MEKLQLFSNAKFYTPFFLSTENSHRDMWLVHLSNHSQARNVMTQVHWRVANHDKTKMNHYGMLGFHGKYEGADQLFNIEALPTIFNSLCCNNSFIYSLKISLSAGVLLATWL
jgi:hypothetical protein